MWIAFASRPLAVAGVAAVLGVVGTRYAAVALALAVVPAAGLVRAGPRGRAALLLGVAAGGTAMLAAWRAREREERALASLRAAPDGPGRSRPGRARLAVTAAGEDPFRARAWIRGRTPDGLGVLAAWPGRLPPGVGPGARVELAGRFQAPGSPGNPGQRDGARSLAASGVSLVADLRAAANLTVLARAPPGPLAWLASLRRRAARRFRAQLPSDVAPLAAALLLGVRGGLDGETRTRFERSGTMHLLAISGMHLVLLAGLAHAGLRRAGAGPRVAAGVTLLLVLAYVPVAGAGAPVRRAAAAIALYTLALARGRPGDAFSATGGAAAWIALSDPADVFRVGFRLSFSAVLAIQLLAPAWHAAWGRRHRLLRRFPAVRRDRRVRLALGGYVLRALPVSLAAWCGTAAWVAHAFGTAAPWAPLVNLVAAPLLVPLLPALVLHAAGCDAAAPLVALLIRTLLGVLDAAGRLPGALVSLPPVPGPCVALWLAGTALLARWPRPGLLAMVVALATVQVAPRPTPRELVALDVGHGQALLLRFPDGSAVLVDAGSRGRPEAGRERVLPALRALGVHELAAAVCTHDDADHWNALPAVLARLPVRRLWVEGAGPEALVRTARRRGVPVAVAHAGAVLHEAGDARLVVLAAGETQPPDDNERSIALLWTVARDRVLLPADREEEGLAALGRALDAAGIGRCRLVVAPHHGARGEGPRRLGRRTRPEVLVVSTGPRFADADTLRAFDARTVARTDRCGCVRVTWDGSERLSVRGYRRAPGALAGPPRADRPPVDAKDGPARAGAESSGGSGSR